MCFCIPQVTQFVASAKERLLPHRSPLQLFPTQRALYCWTMHSDTISSQLFLAGRLRWSLACFWRSWSSFIFASDMFLGLPLLALTRTVPVAFHFLAMFLTVESDSWNLWDSFCSLPLDHNAQHSLFHGHLSIVLSPHVATLQRRVKEKKNTLYLALNSFCQDWLRLSMKLKAYWAHQTNFVF